MTITIFALAVVVLGLLTAEASAITLLVLFSLFGAAAAIELPAMGGAVITPGVLFLPFLTGRAILGRSRAGRSTGVSRAGQWLFLFVLWGVATAVICPWYFRGRTQVMLLDRLVVFGARLYPLRFVGSNFTQSVYAVGELACFLSARTLLNRPGRLNAFRQSILLVGALDVTAVVLNLAEYYGGLPSVLQYVRTAAGYSIAIEYEAGGLARIHGTFPEASLFANYTLPLFAFCLTCWRRRGGSSRFLGALTGSLLAALLISTSGTAYVGLFGYELLYVAREWRNGRPPAVLLLLCLWAAVIVIGLYAFDTSVSAKLTTLFHATVLDKAASASGVERSLWNHQAWINFSDTYGVGAGLGSARASSYPLVLLSNVGVVGTALFLAFVLAVLAGTPSNDGHVDKESDEYTVQHASREAVLASLIASTLAIGMSDLGAPFFLFAAAASVSLPPAASLRGSD